MSFRHGAEVGSRVPEMVSVPGEERQALTASDC